MRRAFRKRIWIRWRRRHGSTTRSSFSVYSTTLIHCSVRRKGNRCAELQRSDDKECRCSSYHRQRSCCCSSAGASSAARRLHRWSCTSGILKSGKRFKRLNLCRRRMLLLPVNDNKDPDRAGGGSHWSLLVYRPNKPFLHFDSKDNSNEHVAEEVQCSESIEGQTSCSLPI